MIKQYDEVRKYFESVGWITRTGWWLYNRLLLPYAYYKGNCRLIAADLRKQKALDAVSRAIQQIIFTGKIKSTVANTRVIIYYILEQSKKRSCNFLKEQQKFCS